MDDGTNYGPGADASAESWWCWCLVWRSPMLGLLWFIRR